MTHKPNTMRRARIQRHKNAKRQRERAEKANADNLEWLRKQHEARKAETEKEE